MANKQKEAKRYFIGFDEKGFAYAMDVKRRKDWDIWLDESADCEPLMRTAPLWARCVPRLESFTFTDPQGLDDEDEEL